MTAQLASHLTQVTEQPYLARRQNWANQLERHALMQPNATALRFLGNTVTWADLRRRVAALADALSRRGVGFGDRVMILMLNRPEFVESVLAANMIGAIAVPLNSRLTSAEIAFLVEDCEAGVMITEAVPAGVAAGVRDIQPLVNMIVVAGGSSDDSVFGYEDLISEATNKESQPPGPVDIPNEPPALIMYTSGTTGRPRGRRSRAAGFHSGDLIRMDEDGYVWVVDRKKDMIISGGENIYCAEAENVLAGHPGIVEVAVIGRADEKWGEVPIAVAAVTDDQPRIEDLVEFLAERLAPYKHPKALEIVDALPRNLRARFSKLNCVCATEVSYPEKRCVSMEFTTRKES